MTPFLNKTSLSKPFCSLRSGFQRAIYDDSKFFLVLAFFGAFQMTAHVMTSHLRWQPIHSLYDWKAFYRVKIVFYSSCMNDGEFINFYILFSSLVSFAFRLLVFFICLFFIFLLFFEINILIHIRLWGRVSDKNVFT